MRFSVFVALLLFPTAAIAAPPLPVHYGVNLCGAEFGDSALPGQFDTNYTYPTPSELDYYASKGRTVIRLPFRWERIQPALNAPLDPAELARLKDLLDAAEARKIRVLVDVHNYGRYHLPCDPAGKFEIIGSPRLPATAFADLWSKLAAALKDEKSVFAYGLMNEPHDMDDETRWPTAAQLAIDAIRKEDSKTTIFVPGDHWSGAKSWRTSSNETLNEKVHDPADNLVFETHCYFDKDLSGTYAKSYEEEGGNPDVGIDHVRPFIEWCQAKNVRGFVGEFGVPATDFRWLATLDRFLIYLQENNMGGTYWAGGPWWGKYPLSIEPADAREVKPSGQRVPDKPQMLVLWQYPG